MIVLGVDPGLSGAIASYDGTTLMVEDMPTIQFKGTKKMKTRIVLTELADMMQVQFDGADHAYIEEVSAMPGQGVTSMFNFGTSFGIIQMAVAMIGVPITMVSPMKWKMEMGLNSDAEKSRNRALQLFPNSVEKFKRKMDHNRAEAALIAWYGYKMLTVGRVR